MRILKMAVIFACVSLVICSCDGGSPDLVIAALETTGTPSVTEDTIQVPIRVVVKNQGSAAAGISKLETVYTGSGGTFVVAFTVPGQADIWYPHTSASVPAGSEETFSGWVSFLPSVQGETVTLKAVADSCSGDEFMPEYCRVEESNEVNNESSAISISLP